MPTLRISKTEEALLSRVSTITGIPLQTLIDKFREISHDGRRQVVYQLKRVLKLYGNNPKDLSQLQELLKGLSQ